VKKSTREGFCSHAILSVEILERAFFEINMTQSEIIQRLQPVFDDIFLEPVAVTPELTADDVEEWTSILHVSLVLGVEDAFKIRFRVGEVEATKNVGDLANLISRRLREASA